MHRLDAGTTGVMVVAKSERAYSALKRAFKERTVDKRYARAGPGPPRPDQRHHRRADRPAPDRGLQVRGRRRRARRASPTTRPSRRSGPPPCSTSTSRPGAPTRSGCTWRRVRHPCVGDLTYGADPALAAPARADPAVAARPRARASRTRAPASGCVVDSPFPADLQHALDVLPRASPTESRTGRTGMTVMAVPPLCSSPPTAVRSPSSRSTTATTRSAAAAVGWSAACRRRCRPPRTPSGCAPR